MLFDFHAQSLVAIQRFNEIKKKKQRRFARNPEKEKGSRVRSESEEKIKLTHTIHVGCFSSNI